MKLRVMLAVMVAPALVVGVAPEANGKGGVVITTCDQTVMTDAVLGLDLVCPSQGITAAASGITIDLDGHTLRGTNPSVSFGVFVTAPDHVTVKNGIISALFLWLGFVVTTIFVNNAYPGRKYILSVIDSIHWLGVLVIEGAVIGAIGV